MRQGGLQSKKAVEAFEEQEVRCDYNMVSEAH